MLRSHVKLRRPFVSSGGLMQMNAANRTSRSYTLFCHVNCLTLSLPENCRNTLVGFHRSLKVQVMTASILNLEWLMKCGPTLCISSWVFIRDLRKTEAVSSAMLIKHNRKMTAFFLSDAMRQKLVFSSCVCLPVDVLDFGRFMPVGRTALAVTELSPLL